MPIIRHDDRPIEVLPRGRRRILSSRQLGAESTCVFEQWLPTDGYIPLHYHDVEEVVVLVRGQLKVSLAGDQHDVRAPTTLVIPAEAVHGMQPAPGSGEAYLLAIFPTAEPKMFLPDGTPYTEWESAKLQ